MPNEPPSDSNSPASFSLFEGGPVYRLEQKLGLVQDGRKRRGFCVLLVLLIGWVPMLLLAAAQGLAIGPTRLESFLMDFAVNARFLVTVPLFLLGEAICRAKLTIVVQQFLDAGLVKDESRAQFDATVRDTVALSRSGRTDVALLSLAYLHSASALVVVLFELQDSTWRVPMTNGHAVISLAGVWFFLVAFPLYSFLMWRWLLRIALWWRLLWQVSGLDLRIIPAHRDGAGGLEFLGTSVEAFTPFIFGVMSFAAALVADFVVYEGDSPLQYQWHVIGLVGFLLILIAGPSLFFVRALYKAREEAIFRYGALASCQIQRVEEKWLPEGLVGESGESSMPDFRSITHLGHSVTAVHKMALIPLTKERILLLLVVALLPFIPVLATQVPIGEIISVVLKVLG
jgi:hypothetical protein